MFMVVATKHICRKSSEIKVKSGCSSKSRNIEVRGHYIAKENLKLLGKKIYTDAHMYSSAGFEYFVKSGFE